MSEAPARGIRTFGSFALDLDRGCLLQDGVEVPLRPKTFAVLSFLAANPGRLVSKDELIRVIWRGAIVSDDVLVQSVGELRRALGESGEGVIRTVPRRGYRFDADISIAGAAPDRPLTSQPLLLPQPLMRRPRWMPVAAMLVLLSIAVAGAWMYFSRATTPSRAKPAIAVLPLENLSEPQRQYFADGLTRDLIQALGRFSSLTVVSWEAVEPHRGAAGEDPTRIARELDVQYQIKGSVQRTAERLLVKLQLLTSQGGVLWSRDFDAPVAELFPLQEKLVQEISAAMALQVADFELQRVAWTRPGNLDAYDYLLRARAVVPDGPNGIAEARALIRQALEIDPGYAAAWSAKAATYLLSAGEGWGEPPARRLEQAREAATQALKLDPRDVMAHVILGRIHLLFSRHEQARDEMEQALAINPNDSLALEGYGEVLVWLGETDKGMEVLQTARRIKPGMQGSQLFALSVGYYLKGRCSDAIAIGSGQAPPSQTEVTTAPLLLAAACHVQLGQADMAARLLRKARELDPLYDERIQTFGTWLHKPQDLQRLRDDLVKAGQPPVWNAIASARF